LWCILWDLEWKRRSESSSCHLRSSYFCMIFVLHFSLFSWLALIWVYQGYPKRWFLGNESVLCRITSRPSLGAFRVVLTQISAIFGSVSFLFFASSLSLNIVLGNWRPPGWVGRSSATSTARLGTVHAPRAALVLSPAGSRSPGSSPSVLVSLPCFPSALVQFLHAYVVARPGGEQNPPPRLVLCSRAHRC
jgi:hypothetical protein